MAAGESFRINITPGRALSAFGSLFEGGAAIEANRFNAGMERWNATLARQNAAEAERRFRRLSKKRMGTLRANRGASGIALDGSALDALADSAMQEELDALTIRYEGEMRARSHEYNARLADAQAKAAKKATFFDVLGGLFG